VTAQQYRDGYRVIAERENKTYHHQVRAEAIANGTATLKVCGAVGPRSKTQASITGGGRSVDLFDRSQVHAGIQ
jgi:hypothetical protein